MAEAERRPNLGQRVIGSAKGLACSTFSGMAGIENELRDPLRHVSGGKAVSPGNGSRGIEKSSAAARRKSSNSLALKAFRSQRARERQLEEGFEQWVDEKATLDSSLPDRTNMTIESPSQDLDGQSSTAQDIFHFGQQHAQPSSTSQADLESSWQSSRRKLAGERLSQLERHISGSFALRTRSNTFVEPYGGLDIQDQKSLPGEMIRIDTPMQDLLEVVQPGSHASLDRAWNEQPSTVATTTTYSPYPPAHTIEMLWQRGSDRSSMFSNSQRGVAAQPTSTQAKTIEQSSSQQSSPLQSALHPLPGTTPSTRYLTCPLPSCHDLLASQNANLPLSIHQRCCVHSGCGYVSQDLDGWVKHCTSRHDHALSPRNGGAGEGKDGCQHCAIKSRGIISTDFRLVVEGRCCVAAA